MDAEDVVLGIVAACDDEVEGRTYLQKIAFFVSERLRLPLGFGPHYYGPYSPLVAAELHSQVEMGRLQETCTRFASSSDFPFERLRYAYALTDDGTSYLDAIGALDLEGFKALEAVVSNIRQSGANYLQLSLAAKLYYLLGEAGGRISKDEAQQEAGKLDWELGETDFKTAVEVLRELDLVE